VLAQALAPILAQNAPTPKNAPSPDKPYLFEEAGDYSETHALIVIGVAHGRKETGLTGEQIADKLADVIKKVHGAPSKTFVKPGGDYTAIIFAVHGHLYGPYSLKESLTGLSLAADDYNEKVHRGVFPGAGVPAPAKGEGKSSPLR
jgi:hypothetical protein